jgi:hypothetical protein
MNRDVYERLYASVPRGYRQDILNPVIELVVEAIEEQGKVVIGAILAGKFKLVRDESVKGS